MVGLLGVAVITVGTVLCNALIWRRKCTRQKKSYKKMPPQVVMETIKDTVMFHCIYMLLLLINGLISSHIPSRALQLSLCVHMDQIF